MTCLGAGGAREVWETPIELLTSMAEHANSVASGAEMRTKVISLMVRFMVVVRGQETAIVTSDVTMRGHLAIL